MNSVKKDKMLEEAKNTLKVQCEYCGHKEILFKKDRKICSWCKHYIYKDDKAKFKYTLSSMLKSKINKPF